MSDDEEFESEELDQREMIRAYDKLSYYLAARDHSLKELHLKLSKNFSQNIVNATLAKAIDYGMITSPAELAEKTAQMLHGKNKGYYYIKNYLREKGLPEVEKEVDIEIDKACAILDNQFRADEPLSYEQKQKAMRLLNNRGFDSETIKKVVYEIFRNS